MFCFVSVLFCVFVLRCFFFVLFVCFVWFGFVLFGSLFLCWFDSICICSRQLIITALYILIVCFHPFLVWSVQLTAWLGKVGSGTLSNFHASNLPSSETNNKSSEQLGVSENNGTPKSSILIGFSIINHPFWGTSVFGNPQLELVCFAAWVLRVTWSNMWTTSFQEWAICLGFSEMGSTSEIGSTVKDSKNSVVVPDLFTRCCKHILPSPLRNKASLGDYWPWSLNNPLVRPWVGGGALKFPLRIFKLWGRVFLPRMWSTVRSMGSCLGPTRSGSRLIKRKISTTPFVFLQEKRKATGMYLCFFSPF